MENKKIDELISAADKKCQDLEEEIERERQAFEKTIENKIEQAKRKIRIEKRQSITINK